MSTTAKLATRVNSVVDDGDARPPGIERIADGNRMAVDFADFQVHEEVQQVGAVDVDGGRLQVLIKAIGIEELGVDADDVAVPQVAVDAGAEQVVVVVLGR